MTFNPLLDQYVLPPFCLPFTFIASLYDCFTHDHLCLFRASRESIVAPAAWLSKPKRHSSNRRPSLSAPSVCWVRYGDCGRALSCLLVGPVLTPGYSCDCVYSMTTFLRNNTRPQEQEWLHPLLEEHWSGLPHSPHCHRGYVQEKWDRSAWLGSIV
jgi:hypothetical protein